MLPADSPEVLARFNEQLGLVKIIAGQIAKTVGAHVEFDELMSGGREGLLDAARKYDPERGVPFKMYANYRVRGAMVDSVRKISALPRRAHERLAMLEAAAHVNEGEAEYAVARRAAGIAPGAAEEALAEHVAALATAVATGLVAEVVRGGSSEGVEAVSGSNPEEELERAELLHLVRESLSGLPKEEGEIVRRVYFEGQCLEDVAAALDVSRSWASRLHTRAMSRLTKRIRQAS